MSVRGRRRRRRRQACGPAGAASRGAEPQHALCRDLAGAGGASPRRRDHRAAQHRCPDSILAIMPLAAFLAITAMGEALVLMSRGIDLSIPAIITLSSTVLLGVSGGHDEDLVIAVAGGACLRDPGRAGQRRPGRRGEAERPDRHPRRRRDHARRDALVSREPAAGVARAAAACRLGRLAHPRHQRLGLGGGDPGDRAHRRRSARRPSAGASPRPAPIRARPGSPASTSPAYQIAAFTVAGFLYGVAGIVHLGLHPQPDAQCRRSLSAGADRRRRARRHRHHRRHRQHGRGRRRRALPHPSRPDAEDARPVDAPSSSSSRASPSPSAWRSPSPASDCGGG